MMLRRFAEENKEDDEVSLQRPSLMNQSTSDGESTVINQAPLTMIATTGNTGTTSSSRREGEDPSSLDASKNSTPPCNNKTMGLQHASCSPEEQQVNMHVSSKQTIRKRRGGFPQLSPGVVSIPGPSEVGNSPQMMMNGSPSSTARDFGIKKPFNRLELAPRYHYASGNSNTEAFSHRGRTTKPIDLDSGKGIVEENERSDDGFLFPGVVRVGQNHDDSTLRESETHITQGQPPSDYVITAEVVPNTDDIERENERLREELRRQQGEPVVTAKVVNDDEENATFFSRWWKCIAVALVVLVGVAVGMALVLSSSNDSSDDGPATTTTTAASTPPLTPQPIPPPFTPQSTPLPPTPTTQPTPPPSTPQPTPFSRTPPTQPTPPPPTPQPIPLSPKPTTQSTPPPSTPQPIPLPPTPTIQPTPPPPTPTTQPTAARSTPQPTPLPATPVPQNPL